MSISAFRDAFAHHVWATGVVLDTCATLTPEQLATPCPGTYGPIIDTLRHMVKADSFYLSVITEGRIMEIDEDARLSIAQLGSAMAGYAAEWTNLLATDADAETDSVERGEGWEFHAPLGLRLAQAIHHGTDHRSQICTALTSLGVEPPDIDVWEYGSITERTRGVDLR